MNQTPKSMGEQHYCTVCTVCKKVAVRKCHKQVSRSSDDDIVTTALRLSSGGTAQHNTVQ